MWGFFFKWENRLTVKQPQYLFTTQSLSSNMYVHELLICRMKGSQKKNGEGEQGEDEKVEAILSSEFRWYIRVVFHCHNRNGISDCCIQPAQNAKRWHTTLNVPFLNIVYILHGYMRVVASIYLEKNQCATDATEGTNEDEAKKNQQIRVPDNTPHTILLKHWMRVTMKKTCEFGRK